MNARYLSALLVVVVVFGWSSTVRSQTASELFDQGVAAHGQGRYEQAIELYDRALELDPNFSEAFRKRGLSYRELGDYDRCFADYDRALEADPANGNAYRSYAMALQKLDRHQEAVRWADRGLEVDPDFANLWLTRAVSHNALGDTRRAIADCDRALELDPSNKWAFNTRGLALSSSGASEQAVADFDRALALDPDWTTAVVNRAVDLNKLGRSKEAEEDARRALALNADDAYAYNALGDSLRHQDKLREAVNAYDRAIELKSDFAPPLFYRGWTLIELGRHDDAVEDFTRYLKLRPNNARAYNNRGSARQRAGDLEGALADFKRALNLDPGYRQVADNVALVERKQAESRAAAAPPRRTTRVAAAAPPAPVTSPASIPKIEFSPTDDPCTAAPRSADGLPWQPVSADGPITVEGIPAATLAPFLDAQTMSKAQYTGAVTAAMEGLRLLYGDMTAEQTHLFEAAWAPLFDLPNPAAIEYLNRLNPLLGQFLSGREALARAAVAVQAAMHDAAYAIHANSQDAWIDAMAVADRQTAVAESLNAGLVEVARRIAELGNPPNPFDERCQARRQFRRALEDDSASPIDGMWHDADGNWLSIMTVYSPEPGMWVLYMVSQEYMERIEPLDAAGYDVSQADIIEICPDGGSDCDLDKEFHHVAGIFDLMWIGRTMPSSDALVLTSYGTPMGVFGEAWHFVNDGVADRLQVDVPPAVFGGDPKWTSGRYWRDPHSEPVYCYQHTPERVAAAERFKEYALENWSGFLGNNAQLVAQLEAGSTPDPDTPPPQAPQAVTAAPKPTPAAPSAEEQAARQAIEETIAFHESMAAVLARNLERERDELAKTKDPKRRKELALRVMTLQADIQAEKDRAESYRTGRLVHTRTAYDDWTQGQFVRNVRENAARVDAARKIAVGVERQIELLPWEQRAAMRAKAREILDPETVARGDVEKAKKLADALNNMVMGHWEGEAAREEEKAIAAQEHEFIAQTVVMTAGSIATGFGSAACAQAFGETAAITLWSPHILGGVYGGLTGTIAGGPAEGVTSAISEASPLGAIGVQFVESYRRAARNPQADWRDALWQGAKDAGTSWAISKSFQIGANLTARGALAVFGKDSRLFRPVGWQRPTVAQQFAAARFQQDIDDARSLVNHFRDSQVAAMRARTQFPAGSPELAAAERQVRELAASLNSSYHCKWMLKYEAHPSVRRAFSRAVDQNYDEMMPGFEQALRGMGYDTSNLRFRPLRNASSAGSSSMDLDLALDEPAGLEIVRIDPNTGARTVVDVPQFQDDAQRALNRAYHDATGFSAIRSEVNLTTSAHGESFSSKALLRERVDFSRVDPRDVADIGRVVDVKGSKIADDPVMSPIARIQGRCRESAKEIDNMLLKKLRQDLAAATPGSPEAQQLAADVRYWEDMSARMKQIGNEETDPYRILEIDRQLRLDTGGLGAAEISEELARTFRRFGE
jgi:tetratricopeptide (TPR) repeat protein